jgi:hypothetical protein
MLAMKEGTAIYGRQPYAHGSLDKPYKNLANIQHSHAQAVNGGLSSQP